jgi:hypothetical protein
VQLVAGKVAVQSVVLDEVKVTVPVAPLGRPVSARVALVASAMVAEAAPLTVIEKEVVAGETVRLTVLVELEAPLLASPE